MPVRKTSKRHIGDEPGNHGLLLSVRPRHAHIGVTIRLHALSGDATYNTINVAYFKKGVAFLYVFRFCYNMYVFFMVVNRG